MYTYGGERQHLSGIWLIQKRPRYYRFALDWFKYCAELQLVSDLPSIAPNHPEFSENRHDQSVFSLLIYKYGLSLILEDRTYPREISPIIYAARNKNRV